LLLCLVQKAASTQLALQPSDALLRHIIIIYANIHAFGKSTVYPPFKLTAVGVGRGDDLLLTGFHPFWDEILSQNLQAVADQGCHLEEFSPYKGPLVGGLYWNRGFIL
jgi:hypothetical protein